MMAPVAQLKQVTVPTISFLALQLRFFLCNCPLYGHVKRLTVHSMIAYASPAVHSEAPPFFSIAKLCKSRTILALPN
jgi:hypothetical protein